MGVISILLGIILFLGFTGIGVFAAQFVVEMKTVLASSLTVLAQGSDTAMTIAIIGVFGFIGLISGLNLVMHGLTYNKVCKLSKRRRHRAD